MIHSPQGYLNFIIDILKRVAGGKEEGRKGGREGGGRNLRTVLLTPHLDHEGISSRRIVFHLGGLLFHM